MRSVKKDTLYTEIKAILTQARQTAYRAVNLTMVIAYWEIGKRIVQEEQGGKEKAVYGEELIKDLARRLTDEFGKGFSLASLKNFRQFYLTFPETEKSYAVRSQLEKGGNLPIRNALRSELGWAHYRLLMRVENEAARTYYLNEAIT